MKKEKRKLSGRKKIVFFIVLLLVSFSVVVSFGHEKKEIKERHGTSASIIPSGDNIIWEIRCVDSKSKLNGYIYSTSEWGCRCHHRPYEFKDLYMQFPNTLTDSTVVMEQFQEFYGKDYIVYEVYPFCFVKDWYEDISEENGNLLTVRKESVDTWLICQQLGLIDSTGYYTN